MLLCCSVADRLVPCVSCRVCPRGCSSSRLPLLEAPHIIPVALLCTPFLPVLDGALQPVGLGLAVHCCWWDWGAQQWGQLVVVLVGQRYRASPDATEQRYRASPDATENFLLQQLHPLTKTHCSCPSTQSPARPDAQIGFSLYFHNFSPMMACDACSLCV